MRALLIFLTSTAAGVLASTSIDPELDVLYSNCLRYDADLFGGHVCGSDGNTYRNIVILSCYNHWRQPHHRVNISSQGLCPGQGMGGQPWSPLYRPVCGTDGKTYANLEALHFRNRTDVKVAHRGECSRDSICLHDETRGPSVCASNGITYPNARAVRCLREQQSEMYIVHEGGCTKEEVARHYPDRQRLCALSREHYENNPICAADNRTYPNPFVLLCVNPLSSSYYNGLCGCHKEPACRHALRIDYEYQECRKKAILQEVCATDGLTYRSKYHVLCASRNNSYLSVRHEGACNLHDSPCLRTRTDDCGQPVCGSDGVTYATPTALYCIARSRDPQLHYIHDGPCVSRKGYFGNVINETLFYF